MDFQHYHPLAEIEWWMRKWAHERPDIVDLTPGRHELRRAPDLPAHDHQQGARQGDRQAGGLLRRRTIVQPDTVTVELPEGSGRVVAPAPGFFLKGDQRLTVATRLASTAEDPQGRFTVRAASTRGGVQTATPLFAQASRRGAR